MMSPAIREIRRLYPKAHIALLVLESAKSLAEHCPYIDEIIGDAHRCHLKDFLSIYQWNIELAKKLLTRRYDMIFPIIGFPSMLLLAYMGGVKKILAFKSDAVENVVEPFGAKVYEPFVFEMAQPNTKFNETHNFSNYMLMVDAVAQYPLLNREGEVWLSASDRTFALDLLRTDISNDRKIYVICMGGTTARKHWPPQNYARLAQMILEQEYQKVRFVLTGGGQVDEQLATIFKQSLGEQFVADYILDMVNKCNYRQSGALLDIADMYIGNDTGTLHLASAAKTPVLTPNCFAANLDPHSSTVIKACYPYHVPSVTVQPKHTLPECDGSDDLLGCRVYTRPHCITQITVEKMFEAYNILKERITANNIEPLFIS